MEDVVTGAAQNPLARDLDEVLEAMGSLWDELRGARIFITGGTGFFGCWLLETLLWANDKRGLDARVTVLTRNADAFGRRVPHLAGHSIVTLHTGDVRSFDFPTGEFSHLIHAASDPGPIRDRDDRWRQFHITVDGTERVLSFGRSKRPRRSLYTSSGAVYGRQPNSVACVNEDYPGAPDPLDPSSSYGEAKRIGEMLCAEACTDGLPVGIARCFAFVGPYLPLDANFAIGNFVADVLNRNAIRLSGDGTAVRSYLYGSDLARWLWTLLLAGEPGRPYNVGSPEAISILELARLVRDVAKRDLPIEVPLEPSGAPPHRYVPDVHRTAHELGLAPLVSMRDAISRTLSWHTRGMLS